VKITVAYMTLHNFIKRHALKYFKFHSCDGDEDFLHTNDMEEDEAQKESSIHDRYQIKIYEY
jgi:hypothetical protein